MEYIKRKFMSSLASLKPPRQVGMTKLDKSKFNLNFRVWSLLLPEIKYINEFLGKNQKKTISEENFVLALPQRSSLVEFSKDEIPSELYELINIKNPKLKGLLLTDLIKVTESDEQNLNDINYEPELLKSNISHETYSRLKELGAKYKVYDIQLDFDYWSYDDIIKSFLPDELIDNCPSAFTIAGHLAHLNLKEEYMPYRFIIGEVILEKFVNIRTVVNKTNNITSEFRTFEMELLAGEDNTVVTQKESGCSFTFDFRKVYWNSRLATEHDRLINSFKTGDVVCDVMAGVGPFAVPAGKKPCLVFANDLNPESYKYLGINVNNNKVEKFVRASNLDGREFIQKSPMMVYNFSQDVKTIKYMEKLQSREKPRKGTKPSTDNQRPLNKKRMLDFNVPSFPSHYVMNLPDSAITFVDSYIGLYSNAFTDLSKEEVMQLPGFKLPVINVHHFEKYKEDEIDMNNIEGELESRMHKKIVQQLNFEIPIENIQFHVVRQVAPCKLMYCISFQLPEEVAFA